LKASDIKVGCVYYVDYEPTLRCEFNGLHMSVVLKKNDDKQTFVVMPLTSSARGSGMNKVNIGKIAGLPPNTRGIDSYAVYNQVRTVNYLRFKAIKLRRKSIDVPIKHETFTLLYNLAIRDLLHNVHQDDRLLILKRAYDSERYNRAKNLAYTIIKHRNNKTNEEKITALKTEIREILNGVSETLDAEQTTAEIQKIFYEVLNA